MNKCDFCYYSCNRDGKLICPYDRCKLFQWELNEIMDRLGDKRKGDKHDEY